MKDMRRFYEAWQMLDSNSAVTTAELQSTENVIIDNSSVVTAEMPQPIGNAEEIDIYHAISVRDINFPIEDFFKVPFSHHSRIIFGTKELRDRYYYIRRTAEEHLSVEKLKQLIRDKAHEHQGDMPNNFASTMLDKREARKAVMMFKDDYLLNFINIEEIGERDQRSVRASCRERV